MYTQLNANFIEQSLFCLRRTVDKHLLAFTEPSVSSHHRDIASLSPWVISASGFRDSLLSCTLAGPYCRWSIPHSAFWDEIWVSVLTSRCVYIRVCVSLPAPILTSTLVYLFIHLGVCVPSSAHQSSTVRHQEYHKNCGRRGPLSCLSFVSTWDMKDMSRQRFTTVYEEAIFVWKTAHLWINKMSEVVVSET